MKFKSSLNFLGGGNLSSTKMPNPKIRWQNIRRWLALSVFCILSVSVYGQQTDSLELNGTITDNLSKPLSGVTITVRCDSTQFQATSDESGNYRLKYTASKTCSIAFSKSGYETISATFDPQPVTTISLPLMPDGKTINLAEVTVKGDNTVTNGNKTSYLPDKRQRNASHDGIDLLFRLGIPMINVNPMEGTVSSADMTSVSFYIENRKVSAGEIKQIRAKDIKRVEYYNNATDLFPGEQKVLNYVLYHYETGGYVDLSSDTRFLYRTGNYTGQVSVDKGKVNFTAFGGYYHSKDDDIMTENIEQVRLEQPFTRTTSPIMGFSKNHGNYELFRTTYNTKQMTVFGQVSVGQSKTPKNVSSSAVNYLPAIYPSETANNSSSSRGNSINGNFYLRREFKNGDSFDSRVAYAYGDNTYDRLYTETSKISNHAKEYANRLEVSMKYILHFNKKTSLTLYALDIYRNSSARYTLESGIDKQDLYSNAFLFFPTFQTKFGEKISLGVRPGFDLDVYKANGYERKTKLWARPEVTFYWEVSPKSRINIYSTMGSTMPQLSTFNSARQRMNNYEVVEGNPSLNCMSLFHTMFSYSLILKNLELAYFFSYEGSYDKIIDSYKAEGQTLVHTYVNDGNFNNINTGFQGTLRLMDRKLQLQGGSFLHHWSSTGNVSSHCNYITFHLSAIAYMGNFNTYAFFDTPSKYLNTSSMKGKTNPAYGLSAGWSQAGWKLEAGAKNFLTKTKAIHQWYDVGSYAYDSHSRSDSYGPQVYVKMSYSFDFGRKVKRQQIKADDAPQSGILKL